MIISCKPNHIDKDEEIDGQLTAKLDTLNARLVREIAAGHADTLAAFCSDDIKANVDYKRGLRDLVENARDAARSNHCEIRKRFYASYPEKGQNVVLKTGEEGEHEYLIAYRSPTRRTFVTVGYFEDTLKTIALLTVWGSYDGDWKLVSAWAGLAKAYGKDAVDWYYRARQQYGDNALVDAANSMGIARQLLAPGGKYWHYRLEEDMRSLIDQIKSTAERDLNFPIRMPQVKTAPRVFSVSMNVMPNGYFPLINYATNISLQDTVALSRECDSINAHIGEIFNDIDHNNNTLLYRAYASVPLDSAEQLPSYGFVRKSSTWHY